MEIFSLFTLLGGIAFFLYGMSVMSDNLEKLFGSRLEMILKKSISSPIKSLAAGAGITIAIQSSSAVTVMLVGLVNSGIMEFGCTVGFIMGSNIGTTLTAWVLALSGVNGTDFTSRFLNPEGFAPLIAFLGILLIMLSKNDRRKDVGSIFAGFAVMMSGMLFMKSALSPLGDSSLYHQIISFFKNPLLGIIAGIIFTAFVQSSVASIGLLQSLAAAGGLSLGTAIPLIMGLNIGTCISAIYSSRGGNKNSQRVAAVHILFNLIGTIICFLIFYISDAIFQFSFTDSDIGMVEIAFLHTLFNALTALILFPFSNFLEKFAFLAIKGVDDIGEKNTFIDDRLLQTPSFAITECRTFTDRMAVISEEAIRSAIDIIIDYDEKIAEDIMYKEDIVDDYEDKLGTYLVKLSGCSLTKEDANSVSKLLHCIGDFERISDHAVNLIQVSKEMHSKKISFSKAAKTEIYILAAAVTEILEMSVKAFTENDVELARKVEPLEEVIDGLRMELKNRHITRLQQEKCTLELGFVFSDILTNLERVSDHCSNIAVCLIQLENEKFDTHEYITDLKENNKEFQEMRINYVEKYALPPV